MLVGVNNHHQIMVFSCALLMDESIATYEWVLETFLIAMMNKKLIYVVIDGDKEMCKAIKKSHSRCVSLHVFMASPTKCIHECVY